MSNDKKGKVGRPAKEHVKVSYTLDKALAERFAEFCERTDRTKTRVIESALEEYMDKYDK